MVISRHHSRNGRRFFCENGLNLSFLSCALLLSYAVISPPGVSARGRMMEPAQRSSLWTRGFDSPVNNDDTGLNCGGPWVQHGINNGRCGVCGDRYDVIPRDNEPGGRYANGVIANTYTTNDTSMLVVIDVQSYLGGYFEFRICPHNNVHVSVGQDCLDRHQLRVWDLYNKEPRYRYFPSGLGLQRLRVEIPRGMTCTQCVLQWKWHTANDWGRCQDGSSRLGCGPQEEYYNCADIAIETAYTNINLDTPLPSEMPQTELPDSSLNFQMGFNPFGSNSNTGPISFLPNEVFQAGNIGPVIPKFDFFDTAVSQSVVTETTSTQPTTTTSQIKTTTTQPASKSENVVELKFNGAISPESSTSSQVTTEAATSVSTTTVAHMIVPSDTTAPPTESNNATTSERSSTAATATPETPASVSTEAPLATGTDVQVNAGGVALPTFVIPLLSALSDPTSTMDDLSHDLSQSGLKVKVGMGASDLIPPRSPFSLSNQFPGTDTDSANQTPDATETTPTQSTDTPTTTSATTTSGVADSGIVLIPDGPEATIVRKRRQAPGIPPPPPPSVDKPAAEPTNYVPAADPPVADPMMFQDPQPEQRTITFGGLIGDSFNRGGSMMQKEFFSQQDFNFQRPAPSLREQSATLTNEALAEPVSIPAVQSYDAIMAQQSQQGARSRGLDGGIVQGNLFESMFVDPMLPAGPGGMDVGGVPSDPNIPPPPRQSHEELAAAIAGAPPLSSAVSDTGIQLDPSALVGAAYIPELMEGRSNQAETSTASRHGTMIVADENPTTNPGGKVEEYLSPSLGTSIVDSRFNTQPDVRSVNMARVGHQLTAEQILAGNTGMTHPTESLDTTGLEAVGPSPTDSANAVPGLLNSILGGSFSSVTDASLDPSVQKTREDLIRQLGEAMGVIGQASSSSASSTTVLKSPISQSASDPTSATSDPALAAILAMTQPKQELAPQPPTPSPASPGGLDLSNIASIQDAISKLMANTTGGQSSSTATDSVGLSMEQLMMETMGSAQGPSSVNEQVPVDPTAMAIEQMMSEGTSQQQPVEPTGMTMEQMMGGGVPLEAQSASQPATGTGIDSFKSQGSLARDQMITQNAMKTLTDISMAATSQAAGAVSQETANQKVADTLSQETAKTVEPKQQVALQPADQALSGDLFGIPGMTMEEMAALFDMVQGGNAQGGSSLGLTDLLNSVNNPTVPAKPAVTEQVSSTNVQTNVVRQQEINKAQTPSKSLDLQSEMNTLVSSKSAHQSSLSSKANSGELSIETQALVKQSKPSSVDAMGLNNQIATDFNNIPAKTAIEMTGKSASTSAQGQFDQVFLNTMTAANNSQNINDIYNAVLAEMASTGGTVEKIPVTPTTTPDPILSGGNFQQGMGTDFSHQTFDATAMDPLYGIFGMGMNTFDPTMFDIHGGSTQNNMFDSNQGQTQISQAPQSSNTQTAEAEAELNALSARSQSSVINTQETSGMGEGNINPSGPTSEPTISLADLLSGNFQTNMFQEQISSQTQPDQFQYDPLTNTWNLQSQTAETQMMNEMGVTGQADISLSSSGVVLGEPTKSQSSMSALPSGLDGTVSIAVDSSTFSVQGPLSGTPQYDTSSNKSAVLSSKSNQALTMTKKSSVSTSRVDPAPTLSTAPSENRTEFASQTRPTTPIPTTKPITLSKNFEATLSAKDRALLEQERKIQKELQMKLKKQQEELQRLDAQRKEQERLLLLEKQKMEYERQQLMLKKQQLDLERQRKAKMLELERKKKEQLQQKLLLEQQRREIELETLKMQREQERQKLLEEKRLEEQRLQEKQRNISAAQQQKKEQMKQEAAANAAKDNTSKQTQSSSATSGAKSSNNKEAPQKPKPTPSFTPIGFVGGTESATADQATVEAWQAVLRAAQVEAGLPVTDIAVQDPQPVVPPMNPAWGSMFSQPSQQTVPQQMIMPQAQTIPSQMLIPQQQGIPQQLLLQQQSLQQQTAQQPIMLPQNLQQQQLLTNWPQLVAAPAVTPAKPSQPSSSSGQNDLLILLQQLQAQQGPTTPAPPTTTTAAPTTTPAPPPKKKVPVRPDAETRNFVRSMFLNAREPGHDPLTILVGLTPEMLMKAGINPLVANSADMAQIVPAVERTLGISLKKIPLNARGARNQRVGASSSGPSPMGLMGMGGMGTAGPSLPPNASPRERAEARRQFMLQQRMMNEMMQVLGLGPEPLEPGDPGYRGPGSRPGATGGPMAPGGPTAGGGGANPFEMTDAQQLAMERRMGRGGGGGGMGMGGMGGMGDPMMGGMGGGMGGGAGAGQQGLRAQMEMLGL